MSQVIKVVWFMIIQSIMQFSENQDTKEEEEKEEKEEKKRLNILGMVKKMMDGFMIKGSGMLMQWMLD